MYVAQTDGKLVAIDLNGMIIVQSKGTLTAFKEPQALKMK